MIDVSNELYTQLQVLKYELELVKWRLSLVENNPVEDEQKRESVERRLQWLNDNDKDQQMQLDNLTRRISNDFPVAPWEDD